MTLNNCLDQAAINRRAITEEGIPLIALSPAYNDKGEVMFYEIGGALRDEWGNLKAYELISGEIVPVDTALACAMEG